MGKSEFNDKITLHFSSSVNKQNEKSSSKSTEIRTLSWLQSKFRFWFPETLWIANLETHLEAGGAGGCILLLGGFVSQAQAYDSRLLPAYTGDSLGAQEGEVTFILTSA